MRRRQSFGCHRVSQALQWMDGKSGRDRRRRAPGRGERTMHRDRPIIGIATQSLDANPAQQLPALWIMGQKYVRALTSAGAVPWLIPLLPESEDTLRCIYEQLDGVFLTG